MKQVEKYKVELNNCKLYKLYVGYCIKGDSKDIAMTIMPCTWSYYYIGKHLYETYKDTLEDNFYKSMDKGIFFRRI